MDIQDDRIEDLKDSIQHCRLCRDCPQHGPPLPHEPRPVMQAGTGARICIASQAPGNKAHQKGLPFYDPSGERLRAWLDVSEERFYDPQQVAIVPMGFCFPGYDGKGGDLPPRRECAETWHESVFRALPNLSLILVIGQYSQRYHLPKRHRERTLTATVANWRAILAENQQPAVLPMPHPSWRNNAWLRNNPWFETQVLPELRQRIRSLLGPESGA